jgi:hypothetical protein
VGERGVLVATMGFALVGVTRAGRGVAVGSVACSAAGHRRRSSNSSPLGSGQTADTPVEEEDGVGALEWEAAWAQAFDKVDVPLAAAVVNGVVLSVAGRMRRFGFLIRGGKAAALVRGGAGGKDFSGRDGEDSTRLTGLGQTIVAVLSLPVPLFGSDDNVGKAARSTSRMERAVRIREGRFGLEEWSKSFPRSQSMSRRKKSSSLGLWTISMMLSRLFHFSGAAVVVIACPLFFRQQRSGRFAFLTPVEHRSKLSRTLLVGQMRGG